MMKSKYTVGIYCDGLREWRRDSSYDHYTSAPAIVAVAETQGDADAWIAAEMERQENAICIMPGQGYHRTYTTVALDDPRAYMSGQDAKRDPCNIGLRKKSLLSDPALVRVGPNGVLQS